MAKTLRDTLHPTLVEHIESHLSHRPNDCADMLSWSADSAVGHACVRIGRLAKAFTDKLDSVVDQDGVWAAAAHQCAIYAFS